MCVCVCACELQQESKLWMKSDNASYFIFGILFRYVCGPGSSVGIATDYELDGPGSNPGGDEIFRPSRPTLGPTQPPVQWIPGLSRG